MIKYNFAKSFYKRPCYILKQDGPYSAELFKENYLIPLLRMAIDNNETLLINFDDVSFSSYSFLKYSFKGLISEYGFDFFQLQKTLIISNKNYSQKVWEILTQEHFNESNLQTN